MHNWKQIILFVRSYVRSFVRTFIHSFIHSSFPKFRKVLGILIKKLKTFNLYVTNGSENGTRSVANLGKLEWMCALTTVQIIVIISWARPLWFSQLAYNLNTGSCKMASRQNVGTPGTPNESEKPSRKPKGISNIIRVSASCMVYFLNFAWCKLHSSF